MQSSLATDLTAPPANAGVRQRLAAKRRRARSLRTTVVGASLATFAGLWLLLYVQLASGNDPALTANAAADVAATRAAAARALHERRHELGVKRRAREKAAKAQAAAVAAAASTSSTATAAAPVATTSTASTGTSTYSTNTASTPNTTASVSLIPVTTRQS
jgi:sRNA-binding protein